MKAFMYCRLDYCNAVLAGAADIQISHGYIQYRITTALIVSGARRRGHISPVMLVFDLGPGLRTQVLVNITVSVQSKQPSLAACAAEDRFQDRAPMCGRVSLASLVLFGLQLNIFSDNDDSVHLGALYVYCDSIASV